MPAGNKVTLGLIQTAVGEDPRRNLEKAVEKIRQAQNAGAEIVCLQELFNLPYFCQECKRHHFGLAEPVPGPTVEVLSGLAREKSTVLIAPVFEKRAEGVYHNSAAVIDADGTLLGLYRKMHLPNDPFFYEKFYFSPGDLGFRTFKTRAADLSVMICWDQWYPEAARLAALQGAQILFYPTAIGWHESETDAEKKTQLEAWQTVQRGHAVANEVFVAAVNRHGKEGAVDFWGHSFVSDPFGKVLAQAGGNDDENLIVECDLSKIAEVRQNWPFLRDRRTDAYEGLKERFLDFQD